MEDKAAAAAEEFLMKCEESGDAAYGQLRSILEMLEDPSTRTQARIFLSHLQTRFSPTEEASIECLSKYHFRIHNLFLDHPQATHVGNRIGTFGDVGRKKLTMMVIPSIFIPEDWSFTFYEGLNRHPDSIFKDKIVAELGCGNGWITIALADKWLPLKVYGLDINPRAVKVSWINLYLNAFDERGQPIYDAEGKTLLDRVEFHESDLLAYCRDRDIKLERIVGCIPQILNPNPEAMSKMITENASEEFLYSLSNYCALQGFVEDQFGLGLIARAVEEGIAVIKPAGIMIFNMGGRPGQAVCRRLFERRGFLVNKLWQTKVLQAADTDISALVEIENNSPHRFEFFMGLVSDQPICARTAWAYGKAGGRISHALSVYSCQLRQPKEVKEIFEFLKNGYHEVSSSLDLSFEDDSVADEKIPFLAHLSSVLKENSFFPYEPPAGSRHFRDLIAGFMRTYHHIPLSADNIIVFPSRAVAIENALRLFSPQLAIVDEHLTVHLPQSWLTSLAIKNGEEEGSSGIAVIEAPRQSDLMVELIKKLKPQVVITGLAQFEAVTSSAFQHLLDITQEIGSRLLLDISDHFELSSLPVSIGVLKYLSGTRLPSHATIVCALVKNKVYSDLEVAFVISEEQPIFKALSKTVELLEGDTAAISQSYYGCLLHELLAFQLADRRRPLERDDHKAGSSGVTGISNSAASVLNEAELSITPSESSLIVHMDADQIFLPIPSPVKAAIFESFSRQNISEVELDVTPSIGLHVRSCYGYPADSSTGYIYATSSLALFNKLVLCCIQDGGTFCFPAGSNGNYVSAAKFLKANIATVPTEFAEGFKLTGRTLSGMLESVNKPWVYVSGPTINPTGLVYSNQEMEDILSVCCKLGAKVVIDTSFSGLEYNCDDGHAWDIVGTLSKLNMCKNPAFSVCLLGGLSLNMLTRGLEFGFLLLSEPEIVNVFNTFPGLSKPHGTVRHAVKKLLGLRERKSGELLDAVAAHIGTLHSRSACLKEELEKNGWDVIEPHGGVSLIAKPTTYLDKTVSFQSSIKDRVEASGRSTCQVKISSSNIRATILESTGLCINSSLWTGIPGYCRFTFALDGKEFERAVGCITRFRSLVSD